MEKLRESYTQQTRNLKDLRDYSTQGLQTVRDQYLDQVRKHLKSCRKLLN